ncbi:MAG: putative rane protein [Frankiales bacterium]|nr:putative rane protein [Frankiales bacterium]
MIWTAVLLTAAGCYALKLSGWFVPASLLERPRIRVAASVLPVALLAALVVVQVFGAGRSLAVDSRSAALVAGAVCLWLRLPFLVVVLVAAATAAALRAL